jgi:hypothetical protein
MLDGGGSATMYVKEEGEDAMSEVPVRKGSAYSDERPLVNGIAVIETVGEPTPYARTISSVPVDCNTEGQDILTAYWTNVHEPTSNPLLEVQWEKCRDFSEGYPAATPFQETKLCHVRVGSPLPFDNKRPLYTREDLTWRTFVLWEEGVAKQSTYFPVWPSGGDFEAAPCGETKEFYLTCDAGDEEAFYRTLGSVRVRKFCE